MRFSPSCLSTSRLVGCLVLIASMLVVLPSSAQAQAAAKFDPDNAFFAVALENFFPGEINGKKIKRLNIYIARREGKWISAVGTATFKGQPIWNTALMPADPSQLKVDAQKLSGPVRITFVPDPWVPADQKPRTGTVSFDVGFGPGDDKGASATMKGKWSVAMDDPEAELTAAGLPTKAEGEVTGGIGGVSVPEIDNVNYEMMFYNLLPGDIKESFTRRRMISMGFKDGAPISARIATVDNMQNATVYQPLAKPDPKLIKLEPDTISGTYHFTTQTTDGDVAGYELTLNGKRTANWVAGTWTAQVRYEDQPDATPLQLSGFFRGSVWKGAPQPMAEDNKPWFTPVPGFVAPAPGEHPRLFFRKSDVARLRERAKTPEGQAIVKRLRETLNGSDGESMPKLINSSTKAYGGNKAVENEKETEKSEAAAVPGDQSKVIYTISHCAGYGMLYQLTGEQKYADLGRKAMELALEGVRDRDDRYAWKDPGGALRAGPAVGWYAVGYDLCYDGWDDAFRRKVVAAILDYEKGQKSYSLSALARGTAQFPGSNHWGAQVGGGALAVLAIKGDPGADDAKLAKLLEANAKCMVRNVTEGFGDHGFFAEGDGAGTISSDTAFIPALQAWRVAGGRDFVAARSNFQWLTMKWVMLSLPVQADKPPFPMRGAYGHNVWSRRGFSGSGTFCQGFGAITDEQKPALLWLYDRTFRQADEKAGQGFDTVNPYPHRPLMSLINWPIGMEARNPATVLPKAAADKLMSLYMFRNRWQDGNDIIVTSLLKPTKGNYTVSHGEVMVWGHGAKTKFPHFLQGDVKEFDTSDNGGVIAMGDQSFGVDFSGASGASAVLVYATSAKPPQPTPLPPAKGVAVESLKTPKYGYIVMTLSPPDQSAPQVTVDGDNVRVGKQTVSFDGKKIVFGR